MQVLETSTADWSTHNYSVADLILNLPFPALTGGNFPSFSILNTVWNHCLPPTSAGNGQLRIRSIEPPKILEAQLGVYNCNCLWNNKRKNHSVDSALLEEDGNGKFEVEGLAHWKTHQLWPICKLSYKRRNDTMCRNSMFQYLKCYSQILCGGSAENFRFCLFFADLVANW